MTPAIFLDKDGTLIDDIPYNVDPVAIRLSDRVSDGLRVLSQLGYPLIVVTNQAGIAQGLFKEEALGPVRQRLGELLASHGAVMAGFYYCPHYPDAAVSEYAFSCDCRKPLPGMLQRAAGEHGIDLGRSWMIGDILNDIEAGHRAGCRSVLIDNGNETEWVLSPERRPDYIATDLHEAALWVASQVAEKGAQ